MKYESRCARFERLEKEGATRVITRFLLFPRAIQGQVRWMELARIEQKAVYENHEAYGCWMDVRWLN